MDAQSKFDFRNISIDFKPDSTISFYGVTRLTICDYCMLNLCPRGFKPPLTIPVFQR